MENAEKVGKFIIIEDLESMTQYKENNETKVFDTWEDALLHCGMLEFPNVLILEVVYNYIEP